MSLRLALYGVGEIGGLLGKVAIKRGHEIVGAVDIDPKIVGKDLGEVLGVGKLGVTVRSGVEDALKEAEIVLHATSSYLPKAYDQFTKIIRLGKSVVSTCETLSYPYHRYPILARRLDELAKTRGATIIGTGINPGFLLDTLVAVLAASVPIVSSVKAKRSLDAATRRQAFRKKIGVGMDPGEYGQKLRSGEYSGHVGYAESVCLIAEAAGLNLTRIVEGQEPVVAEEPVESAGISVKKGEVRGIRGFGAGYLEGHEKIRVEFEAAVGAPEHEEIAIEGENYSVAWRSSGTPGDLGTAAVIVSVAERVESLPYGLLTMADLLPFRIGLR